MSLELIESPDKLDPANDKSWILDEDGKWFFKPVALDLERQTFSAYWYCKESEVEKTHCHLGINLIQVLRGELKVFYEDQEFSIPENKTVFITPGTIHSAKVVPGSEGVLLFIVLSGPTHYPNDPELSYELDAYANLIESQASKLIERL